MSRHVRVSLSSVSPVSHRGIILRLLFGTIQVEKEDRKKKKKKGESIFCKERKSHTLFSRQLCNLQKLKHMLIREPIT